MYIIKINEPISSWYGITSKFIDDELKKAKGDNVQFDINSPGGEVWEGVAIFNAIKNYEGHTTAVITSLGASMASYIPTACDKVIVESNSTVMIHNPWTFAGGDYNDILHTGNMLHGMTNMMSIEYAGKMNISKEEALEIMSKETYYYGQEIMDAGFADEIREPKNKSNKSNKEASITSAKASFSSMQLEMSKKAEKLNIKSIAASLNVESYIIPKSNNNKPSNKTEATKGEKKIMNLKELKAQHPNLVDEIRAEEKIKERKRVKAHLKFIESSKDEVVKNIESGASFMDEEVQAGYLQNQMKSNYIANASGENTDGVNSDNNATPKTKTDAEVKAAAKKVDDSYLDDSPENVAKFLNGEF